MTHAMTSINFVFERVWRWISMVQLLSHAIKYVCHLGPLHQYRFIKLSHKTTLRCVFIGDVICTVFFNYITRRLSLTHRIIRQDNEETKEKEKRRWREKVNKAAKKFNKMSFLCAHTVLTFRCGQHFYFHIRSLNLTLCV